MLGCASKTHKIVQNRLALSAKRASVASAAAIIRSNIGPQFSRPVGHRGHSNRSAAKGKYDPPPPTQPFGRHRAQPDPRRGADKRAPTPVRGHVRYSELAADRFKDFWRD